MRIRQAAADAAELGLCFDRGQILRKERYTVVYVLSKDRRPLMPTKDHRKVRLLLKARVAKVVKRTPFTIQLLKTSHNYTQEITLGVDAGSKTIGLSASTETQELFAAELKPRNDVVELMSTRREFRRARRNRTTRHRKARFENRVHSKHRGWLATSVEVKIHNHVQGIKLITNILPITTIRVENAELDLQRLKAMEEGKPLPVGTDYQLGEMYDQYNVKQYVLFRDGYKCRCCGAHSKGVKFHVHHLESRKTGGDAPDNLITLCESCHKKYHKGLIVLPATAKRKLRPARDAAFMGIMRKTLMERLVKLFPGINVCGTYGYITKYWREKSLLPKSHINDALCIAKHPAAKRINTHYLIAPKRSHNRQIHKATINKGGVRKLNQTPKYVFGFQLFDKVLCKGKECFIFGRRTSGYFSIGKLNGDKISAGINCKKLCLLEKRTNLLIEEETRGAALVAGE